MVIDIYDEQHDYEEQFEIARDLQLGFQWNTDPYMINRLSLSEDKKGVKRALIAELLIAHERGQKLSYSRRPASYVRRKRYCGGAYAFRGTISGVDELVKAGYAVTWIAPARPPRFGRLGTQSTLWATDKLISACPGDAIWPVQFESIWMRDLQGHTCDYIDDEQTRHMRSEVDHINREMREYQIDIDDANITRTERYLIIPHVTKGSGDPCNLYVPNKRPYLRRVFCRASFDYGGRLYGPWQNIPKHYRKRLTINGETVAEPDFKCLHAQLLYAVAGRSMDEAFDPYQADEDFDRLYGKLALLIGVNARTTQATIRALAGAIQKCRKEDFLDISYAAAILRRVKQINDPIKQFIGSDQGVKLQKVDGDLAIRVIQACLKDGIPVLPVHDSFIVPKRFESRTKEHMARELAETLRQLKSQS